MSEQAEDLRLATLERRHIERVVRLTRNMSEAAKQLGIGRTTLYRKVAQYKKQDSQK